MLKVVCTGALTIGLVYGHWWIPAVVVAVAIGVYLDRLGARKNAEAEPARWVWPQDYFDAVGRLGRRIDPEPKRLLPPPEHPDVAHIATTAAGIADLATAKPAFWEWTLFTSVLLRRREAVRDRLRMCSLGYQPQGRELLGPYVYSVLVSELIINAREVMEKLDRLMASPGFRAAFGRDSEDAEGDPDAIIAMADRLMDHHNELLVDAEVCAVTAVEAGAVDFARDACAYLLHPLVDIDRFIVTLCDRVAEAQELLPYLGDTEATLEPAVLDLKPPDGTLPDIIIQHLRVTKPGPP